MKRTLTALLAAVLLSAQPAATDAMLSRISAASLRGNLSFIASDLLEGRNTPSRGLDIAAEYIAAQFRRAGLEPGGDQDYFQNAKTFETEEPNLSDFRLVLEHAGQRLEIPAANVSLNAHEAVNIENAPLYRAGANSEPADLNGKVVLAEMSRDTMRKLGQAKPLAIVTVSRTAPRPRAPQLRDTEFTTATAPRIAISGEEAVKFLADAKNEPATITIHAAAPQRTPVQVHNVIGILRGSDPELSKTCILVTAHYDHLGMKTSGDGDRIYNGANDDGSGTVSVIEVANALASLNPRPKRTIVFITFFGEEEGLLGSRYYSHHPVFPLAQTVADINLEQVGRTDASDARHEREATLTGIEFSDVAKVFEKAAKATGIKIYSPGANSERYFVASDNASLAEAGVPAHTLCVAFNYPDYHALGDEWQKIDYENMAAVDRMVALAVDWLADDPQAPQWTDSPKTERFRKARQK